MGDRPLGGPGSEDFERLGSLLGEACEAAAPAVLSGSAKGARGPGRSAGTGSGGAGARSSGDSSVEPGRLLAVVWPEVVGAEVAANARPVQLRKGRLVVSASSSEWAHTLQYMGEDMKARLNERLGSGAIEQIAFRHAGWEERPRCERGERSPHEHTQPSALSAQQVEALARLEELDLPSEIRDQIARAMKASFVRGEQDSVR
jgi:hypothetical protein